MPYLYTHTHTWRDRLSFPKSRWFRMKEVQRRQKPGLLVQASTQSCPENTWAVLFWGDSRSFPPPLNLPLQLKYLQRAQQRRYRGKQRHHFLQAETHAPKTSFQSMNRRLPAGVPHMWHGPSPNVKGPCFPQSRLPSPINEARASGRGTGQESQTALRVSYWLIFTLRFLLYEIQLKTEPTSWTSYKD